MIIGQTALTVFAALALDAWLGEPRRFHPLAGFGRLAQDVERRLHADEILRGGFAVALLLAPFTVLALLLDRLPWGVVLDALLLYLAFGWKSLEEHAGRVRDALRADDQPAARQRVGLMVSRDTAALDREGVAKATVESVLENGNDAIFGAIFWFVLAGAPGVVLYRLANTLDAMWGYRNARYLRFGRAAARLDDVLNFIPARLTALSYALAGKFTRALRCWRSQGAQWKSPNAGPVMAAGAGSLGVRLGGAACYHGAMQARPPLGEGRPAQIEDIDRALGLIRRSLMLWVLVLFAGGWFVDHVVSA
jgi:adenosylcobinamide-phosphate synthase